MCFAVPKQFAVTVLRDVAACRRILLVNAASSQEIYCTTTRFFIRQSSSSKSWERGAARVKDPLHKEQQNPYLREIRATHDPSLHLKSLEGELKGSTGQALGRQGRKVTTALRSMQDELRRYEELLKHVQNEGRHAIQGGKAASQDTKNPHMSQYRHQLQQSAKSFNELRQQAIQARWELLVHRQAVGFTVNNHSLVMETYPIPEALPTEFDKLAVATEEGNNVASVPQPQPKQWTDQLDWWQRVGRWR
jgi:hypothetical protein